ncbi:serine/threonine protein kinase [Mycobacterium shigaense]|nr:serine/threonine protein kinase [Mycobacterium shigaense]
MGPYELRSLLGTGDTGEVYGAYDTVNDRMVALKLLRGRFTGDAGFRQCFWHESRLVAQLRESHVVPVHDSGEIDGELFLDMQLVEGGSLRDLLREQGVLEPSRAVSIAGQVARALDSAHAAGLVHRDVRPENILLTGDDFAYLTGFGVERSGSWAYTAPERLRGGRIGPQVDVHSLACVLYECLTGETPFHGHEVRDAHLFSPPPRPSIMRRGIGRGLDDVIAIGMAKQPAARYPLAGEFARAAREVVAPVFEPVGAGAGQLPLPRTRPFRALSEPLPAETTPASLARRVDARLVLIGAAVATLVAGLLAAVASVFGDDHTGSQLPPQASAAPAPSAPPPPKTPTLSHPLKGADGLGFVGESARCDPRNPPAAVVRTAKSLAVVCQNLIGTYYYRGERISDGAHIELSNAEHVGDGFEVTNPVDGVVYEVRPHRLKIISNGHVDSSERVLRSSSVVTGVVIDGHVPDIGPQSIAGQVTRSAARRRDFRPCRGGSETWSDAW